MSAVAIVTAVGDELGRFVPVSTLLTGRTPSGMATVLGEGSPDTADTTDPSAGATAVHAVVLRPGQPEGPLVIMTPAWDDVFGYQDLARAFPDDFRVVALAYEERRDERLITTVDELTDRFLPLALSEINDRHGVCVLGWSVGGVVAVDLAERMGADAAVDTIALIDTFFPGEQRHLWSNRWWKYKSLLRPGSFGEAVRELRIMAVRRIKRQAAEVARRVLVWSGTPLPDEPERTSVGGFPVEALSHEIGPVATPVVLYRASTTNPERTLMRWRTVASRIDDVEVPGRHRGFGSIMGPAGVGLIAGDLAARLRPPSNS